MHACNKPFLGSIELLLNRLAILLYYIHNSIVLIICSCFVDSVLLANSMLIVCGIFGAIILVFSSTIVIFTIALCCMHPYTSRQVTPSEYVILVTIIIMYF